jgi:heat shock protein HtpX
MILEIALSVLASLVLMAFSRYREYRADAGSARYVGRDKMIAALRRLKSLSGIADERPDDRLAAFKISASGKIAGLFSSHPPLEDRIAALEKQFVM